MVRWLAQLGADERLHGLVRTLRAKLQAGAGWFRLLFDFSSLAFRDAEVRREPRHLFEEVVDDAACRLAGSWKAYCAGRLRAQPANLSPQALGRTFVATLYGLALQVLMETDEVNSAKQPLWLDELLLALSTP